MKIDLGCGLNRRPGFIGIDQYPNKNVDIVADLDKEGIPLDSNTVDYVYSSHLLEHLFNLDFVIREIYRVCKHNAIVEIHVPHFSFPQYEFHVRTFRYESLKDYEITYYNNKMIGMPDYFKCLSRQLVCTKWYKFFEKFINRHPYLYEQSFLCSFIKCADLIIMFQAIKK